MSDVLIGIVIALTAFFSTLFLTKAWIKISKKSGLTGKDMNKRNGQEIAESGGMTFILGASFAILFYIFFKTFVFQTASNIVEALALLSTIFMAGLIGFVDDILGWKKGLKQWQKPLLTIPIAIPLMSLKIGYSIINVPFIGAIDLGIIFPLLFVPVGIVGAANGFNMLAGYNGLEAGMGAIILTTLALLSLVNGNIWLFLLSISSVAALLGFLVYNKYPAKVFPGDTLTYSVGALIATVAILGNLEKASLFLFLPYFLTFVLKARGRFKPESFARVNSDGSLSMPYKKIYDVTHLSIFLLSKVKRKVYEKDILKLILGTEVILALVALLIF